MNRFDRRTFLLCASAAGLAVNARAQNPPRVDEGEPQAVALGYKHDTTKVDAKKFPKHTNEQRCSNCQLYLAKPNEPWGPCPLFQSKHVNANGWCNSWVKRAT
jgi:hypothetical protein